MRTNEKYNVDLASVQDKKMIFQFANEIDFDVEAQGNESNKHRTLIKLLNSPGIKVAASGVSKTIFLPSDPYEFCDRLKSILQQKQAGSFSDIINEEIII